ncbi:hypothetical protein E2C01_065361 [Portunus trituberculatus]|uniref:Uncharacterized protein n=1 Tax=Portunus trituberculatus TaxID=210409 RepID=A0A5B7HIM4_PORTR|nr:hypothetical protein [Portunus trituberculatus]
MEQKRSNPFDIELVRSGHFAGGYTHRQLLHHANPIGINGIISGVDTLPRRRFSLGMLARGDLTSSASPFPSPVWEAPRATVRTYLPLG